jgi:hypothetical protein
MKLNRCIRELCGVEVIVAIDYEMTRPRILKIIVGIAAFYNVNLATFWLYNSTELILKKCHLCVKFDFTEKREKEGSEKRGKKKKAGQTVRPHFSYHNKRKH